MVNAYVGSICACVRRGINERQIIAFSFSFSSSTSECIVVAAAAALENHKARRLAFPAQQSLMLVWLPRCCMCIARLLLGNYLYTAILESNRRMG